MIFPSPVQDAAFVLRQMGADKVYDYRNMMEGCVRNLTDTDLNLGAAGAVLSNGGFETFTGGIADDWNHLGTGTPSEETTLPWDSSGTSAQLTTGDTDYGNAIFSQSITAGITLNQTYQFNFKIRVTAGYAKIRIVAWTPWYRAMEETFDSSDGAVEGTRYLQFPFGTTLACQVYNAGTSTPLTVLVDDFEFRPVQNDIHANMFPMGYDPAAWDGKSYDYSNSSDYALNWNSGGDLDFTSEVTMISLFTPSATCKGIQSGWDEYNSKKGIVHALNYYGADTVRGYVSDDGATHSIYNGSGTSPYSLGRVVILHEYDGAGGTEETRVNGTDYPVTYSTGAHVDPIYANNTAYCHAGYISSTGSAGWPGKGPFEVIASIPNTTTASEKEFIEALLQSNR